MKNPVLTPTLPDMRKLRMKKAWKEEWRRKGVRAGLDLTNMIFHFV
jgi:hypothetical protein